ncbi:MAG: GNAT family N-acetyltransferase [Coprococcus sp.]
MKFEEWKSIHEYCMSKDCAYETRPFGEYPICYRIAGKIFAQLNAEEEWYKITVKTNPDAADFYRKAYPGVVVRGYHCPPVQQPYWNTIDLYQFDKKMLTQMIDEAYDEVRTHLTKKEQKRLSALAEYRFVKTDGENPEFAMLCGKLDENLDEIVGAKIQRQKYVKYNQRDSIHDVIIAYKGQEAVACGSYKIYDEETVELKRIFVDQSVRGIGVGKELLRRLEADAKIAGYRFAILETGELLPEACGLYKKLGYKEIPNYGPYVDMPESLCMEKKL